MVTTEHGLILMALWSAFGATVVAGLYSLGGRSNKWIRRFAAPAVLMAAYAAIIFVKVKEGAGSWNLIPFLSYPLYAAAWSVGYGVNSQLTRWLGNKYLVRAVTGTAYVSAALPIALSGGHGGAALLGIFLGGLVPILTYLGAKNPFPAAVEEFLIAWYSVSFVLFLPYVV